MARIWDWLKAVWFPRRYATGGVIPKDAPIPRIMGTDEPHHTAAKERMKGKPAI